MTSIPLPAIEATTITPLRVLINLQAYVAGTDIVLDSGNTDAGSTPTTRFREGNVIALAATGRYVEANDANAVLDAAPAAVVSAGHVDGNGVIAVRGSHGLISVTTATGSGTEANNATDLNADTAFAAHYVATSGGGELTITALGTGASEWFYIDASTRDAAGFSEGLANGVAGTDADYRVTMARADLVDRDNAAVNAPVATSRAGHYDESNLINLTDEAKASLLRLGSIFG